MNSWWTKKKSKIKIQNKKLFLNTIKEQQKKNVFKCENEQCLLLNSLLLFPANTLLASHLKYPLFQSLSRFTETGFVRTKRNQFFFGGVFTISIPPQSTRGCGHLSGPGSQCLGTGLWIARPTLAGRQRRLMGHKYLRNKWSQKDVSSWPLDSSYEVCVYLSPIHADRVLNTYTSGRRGWEGVQVHIGPHGAEEVGQAPPGGVWFAWVPVYTTLSVNVWANITSVT